MPLIKTVIVVICLLASTFTVNKYLSLSFSRKLEVHLQKNDSIILNKITDFNWDKVCLYPPYEHRLYEKNISWASNEGVWTIEFIETNKKTSFFQMDRKNFEPETYECFSKNVRIKNISSNHKIVFTSD